MCLNVTFSADDVILTKNPGLLRALACNFPYQLRKSALHYSLSKDRFVIRIASSVHSVLIVVFIAIV